MVVSVAVRDLVGQPDLLGQIQPVLRKVSDLGIAQPSSLMLRVETVGVLGPEPAAAAAAVAETQGREESRG